MNLHLALRWPIWALAVRKSHEAARLGAEVRALRLELAVTRAREDDALAEVAGLKAHFALAVDQRDRARDFAGALVSGLPADGWDATDDALLGAWLDGEMPA